MPNAEWFGIRLEDILTVNEVLEAIQQVHAAALLGPKRYADQYKLTGLKIGNTRMFFAEEVWEMVLDLAANPRRGSSLSQKKQKKSGAKTQKRVLSRDEKKVASNEARSRFQALLDKVKEERSGNLTDYCLQEEARQTLDVTTRERVYQLADFRDGPITTIKVGRTRLYLKSSVLDAKVKTTMGKHHHKLVSVSTR